MVKDILLALSLIIIASIFLVNYQANHEEKAIDSFEACVEAGYPVAESYPERCYAPDGPVFVRTIYYLD